MDNTVVTAGRRGRKGTKRECKKKYNKDFFLIICIVLDIYMFIPLRLSNTLMEK